MADPARSELCLGALHPGPGPELPEGTQGLRQDGFGAHRLNRGRPRGGPVLPALVLAWAFMRPVRDQPSGAQPRIRLPGAFGARRDAPWIRPLPPGRPALRGGRAGSSRKLVPPRPLAGNAVKVRIPRRQCPAAQSRGRPVNALDAPERSLAFREREITVNVTRAAQHVGLLLIISALVGPRARTRRDRTSMFVLTVRQAPVRSISHGG